MGRISFVGPCIESEEQLLSEIISSNYGDYYRKILLKLVNSAGDGAQTRRFQESECPMIARGYRADFEECVTRSLSSKRISNKQRDFAIRFAHYCFSEGHRLNTDRPQTIKRLEQELAN